jgi:Reverse transcriptase (RNA-dependent DNA polymerase).
MNKQGIHQKYIRIFEKLYSKITTKVKTEGTGPSFKLGRGVRQGDPISPKLFTCVLEDVFRKLDWEDKYGITVNGKKNSPTAGLLTIQ